MAAEGLDIRDLRRSLRKRSSLDDKRTAEEKIYSRNLAKTVRRAVRKWQRIYELPPWPVFIFEESNIETDDKLRRGAIATIRIEETALEVYIKYRNTLQPEAVDRVIAHEMGHWVMAPIWYYLFELLDEKNWNVAKSLMEQVIENYTIALVRPKRRPYFDPEIILGTGGQPVKHGH